ncbi:hypothetical protein N7540_000325 [Penicillium herquei]|nr:hypothetical protein N7540_000325 [Penicillium herquei]
MAWVERLRNEAATLQFIRHASNIPVLREHGTIIVDESCFLIMERIPGVKMDNLPEEQKQQMWPEIEQHLATLRAIKPSITGGPSALATPPWRALYKTRHDVLRKQIKAPEYVFCHNDFAQHNIMVHPETLKIVALIHWEYSGFWPAYLKSLL